MNLSEELKVALHISIVDQRMEYLKDREKIISHILESGFTKKRSEKQRQMNIIRNCFKFVLTETNFYNIRRFKNIEEDIERMIYEDEEFGVEFSIRNKYIIKACLAFVMSSICKHKIQFAEYMK